MNKKVVVSATNKTIRKLKVLAKKKEGVRGKLAVTAKTLRLKAKQLATTAKEKESVRDKLAVTAAQLATTAREKEDVRRKLAVTANQLAVTAKEKENIRGKLAVTAETLRRKAKQLATTAKEKESVRDKLAVTAAQLATTAKERENIRGKLAVTAETLRRKAKQLAATAEEKENVRDKLAVTAAQLATTAKERENVRLKLLVTARALRLKAQQLATVAREKESARDKLAVTAKKLATTAREKERVRRKLLVIARTLRLKARQLAVTAKEKESIRGKLAVTAKKIALTNQYARSLIEASVDPLVVINPHGKITDVNAATGQVTGLSRGILIGTDFTKYFTEPQKARAGYKQVFKAGSVVDYPLTIRNKKGRLVDVLYNASVYKDSKGNVLGVFAAAHDVTETKKTRELLAVTARKLAVTAKEKEEVRSKLVVTAEHLATTAKEKESVRRKLLVTANTLRLRAKQLATTAKEKESVRDKLAVTAKKLATTARERESVRRKLLVTAKNLHVKAKRLATTAKEKNSARERLAVTAKKLAATAKEKESVRRKLLVTAQNLNIKAEQLAVTTKKVELANKELQSLDLAKDEFVSIASHQLRTPLTALKGYTGMLIDGDAGPLSDKQREYLTEIKNANDRMINLITALLNVSRVDLGVFVVEPERVNLPNVAEGALKDLELNINEKKLLINKNFEKDLPPINADLNIIRMIFQNLFSNAVKYTPPAGSITLTIKKDGSNILISVADTGYGIPKKVQSKIFTKMFRADNARVKDPDGTGLGLYIVKETIEKTGGKIWFESEENKGSTFYVAIPLVGMKKKEGTRRLVLK